MEGPASDAGGDGSRDPRTKPHPITAHATDAATQMQVCAKLMLCAQGQCASVNVSYALMKKEINV